jgi:hypothetical protein
MGNGRTGQQCGQRFNCQLKPGINKNFWSEDEDRALTNLRRNCGWSVQRAHGQAVPGTLEQCGQS